VACLPLSGELGPGPQSSNGNVMTREQITAALRDLIGQQNSVTVEGLTEETRINDVGFDSLSVLDFMYDMENRFNLRLEVNEMVELDRIRDLIDLLEKKLTV
jgi:acyl carrier protein